MDLLCAATNVRAWPSFSQWNMSADQLADKIDIALKEISGVAMPQLKTAGRSSVYWWNDDRGSLCSMCAYPKAHYKTAS